jgi:hypothetical protein
VDQQCLWDFLPSANSPAIPVKCGSWLACESGGPVDISIDHDAAFAASLKLDSSHRDQQCLRDFLPSADSPATPVKCGSWLACDGGVTVNISIDCDAAFAASLKLDSSHR